MFIKDIKIFTQMKKIIIFVIASIFYLSCQKEEINLIGTVEGKFSIGPLCGIELANAYESYPCGFSLEQLDAIYCKYTVQIIDTRTDKFDAEK